MLTAEEQTAGLQQPTGIGQRPRPMSVEEDYAFVKNSKSNSQLPTTTTKDKYHHFDCTEFQRSQHKDKNTNIQTFI